MKYMIGAAIAALSISASAAIVLQADMQGGGTIYLHDGPGACPPDWLMAEYTSPRGDGVPGCWREVTHEERELILLIFANGAKLAGPKSAFRKPVTS